MRGLTHLEKAKLERELGMPSGYVLKFTNRTFEVFFRDVVAVEILEPRYASGSGSKANRMRAFWSLATDDALARLFRGLVEGWEIYAEAPMSDSARVLLQQIIEKLEGRTNVVPTPPGATEVLTDLVSQKLISRLIQVTAIGPHQRGYEFEKFLKDLFNAYGLSARASFRLTGEQIDGSFVMHNETYLLEAKWENAQTGAADLRNFEGKLQEKATWSRGLFVSNSGFTRDGLEAFGRGKRLVCMDGFDLSEMLRLRRSFVEVLTAKVRRAAETGNPFTSVREIFGS